MSYDLKAEIDRINSVISNGKYKDTDESLSQYEVPSWYKKAKFGIFIHWGVYSQAAFANEWYPRNMYLKDTPEYKHHIETMGPHTEKGYKDYIPLFKGEKFDPEAWINLIKKSGAKYMVPVAEHHDGFQMYKSKLSHWNAFEMGPKRDTTFELEQAARQAGIHFGTSSHRIEHWWFLGDGRNFDSDIKGEFERGDLYWPSNYMYYTSQFDIFAKPEPSTEFMEDWLARTCEIVDRFHPEVLYFDWWIEHAAMRPYVRKAVAYYYNKMDEIGAAGVVNYKHDELIFGAGVPDIERGQFASAKPFTWQTDTAIGFNSWGYVPDNKYKKAVDIVRDLVDVVSKNGNMLLNVGPKGDGSITEEETKVLTEIGKWLSVNGEAIYDSKTWRVYGEGPTEVHEGGFSDGDVKQFTSEDFRFTVSHGKMYAIAMKPSDTGDYVIKSFKPLTDWGKEGTSLIVDGVKALGFDGPVSFKTEEDGIHIHCEKDGEMPVVFKMELR